MSYVYGIINLDAGLSSQHWFGRERRAEMVKVERQVAVMLFVGFAVLIAWNHQAKPATAKAQAETGNSRSKAIAPKLAPPANAWTTENRPVQVSRKAWGRTVTKIIVHHSASFSGNVETFRQHHKGANGWADVGYHFVITNGSGGQDGEIQIGRDVNLQGAHAKGRNADSIGICLVGGESFTAAQKDALVAQLVELCRAYNIRPGMDAIQRHHEKCPGDGLNLAEIIARVQQAF